MIQMPMNLERLLRLYDFTGQTVVITGGTGVLGSEIACALANCGAQLAILDMRLEPGEALLERMGKNAENAALIAVDVLKLDSLRNAAKEVLEKFGKVDCLVNAAGGNQPQATTGPELKFFDLPIDALRWVFDLNILGTILPCQVFGKMMAERGSGIVLNISSMNSFRPLTGSSLLGREGRSEQFHSMAGGAHGLMSIRRASASMRSLPVSS